MIHRNFRVFTPEVWCTGGPQPGLPFQGKNKVEGGAERIRCAAAKYKLGSNPPGFRGVLSDF